MFQFYLPYTVVITYIATSSTEMACIYCNGGVWKIQLLQFLWGILSRTTTQSIVFELLTGQTPSSVKWKSLLYQNVWPLTKLQV